MLQNRDAKITDGLVWHDYVAWHAASDCQTLCYLFSGISAVSLCLFVCVECLHRSVFRQQFTCHWSIRKTLPSDQKQDVFIHIYALLLDTSCIIIGPWCWFQAGYLREIGTSSPFYIKTWDSCHQTLILQKQAFCSTPSKQNKYDLNQIPVYWYNRHWCVFHQKTRLSLPSLVGGIFYPKHFSVYI